MLRTRFCVCVLCAVLTALALFFVSLKPAPATAAAPGTAPAAKLDPNKPVSFINDIAPILKENCFGCHGTKNPKGKFDMTRYDRFRLGGTKEDPVVENKPDESYLIDVLVATDKKRMPPIDSGDPLPREKIDLVRRWIAQGAKLDAGLTKESDLVRELRLRWKSPPPLPAYPYPVTVTALAFTPDNKKLVVSGHHELTVWNPADGKLEKRIRTRARRTMSMQFLADGKLIAGGGRPGEEGDVRVYSLEGKPRTVNGVTFLDGVDDPAVMVKQLLDTSDEVQALSVSADGKKIAAGGCDRLIHLWNLPAGLASVKAEVPLDNHHADWVLGVAFMPDGKHLATASRDKTAKLLNLAAKESALTFPDHQSTVFGVAAKADGKAGYSVGEDNQLRMWNVAGDQAGKQIRNAGAGGKSVYKVINVPGKPLLVTCGGDGLVRIWNADSLANVRTLSGLTDQAYAVAVSPDGNLVAAGGYNGEVRVWKLADGVLVKAFNASPGYKAPQVKK